ncbi:hypothetical protein C7I84_27320 [Mesorhizobium ephedrae]|uniref:Uncharacterized protein n=1 Tax=Kumtagia ephedrae TaxID=2116701 RepID=A0A2P7RNC9_9HYPH|nr:hypothetical protein C7I84_27320 [Mesorhizobium ephedrae]
MFWEGQNRVTVTMPAHELEAGAASPRRADRKEMRRGDRLWSALQTHLQGLDGATLAMMPEERHAALLSRRVDTAVIAAPAPTCNRGCDLQQGSEQRAPPGWYLKAASGALVVRQAHHEGCWEVAPSATTDPPQRQQRQAEAYQ